MPHRHSEAAFARAKKLFPGGVNSPARACRSVGADPVFAARGDGAWVIDVDQNRYLDYVGAFGPMILGPGRGRRVGREGRPRGLHHLLQNAQADATSANAPRAASIVRSMCSSSWANEGNQASNCDGGG